MGDNIVRGFITHKIDEDYELCEDYFFIDLERKQFCVADGAGSSFYSGFFAKLITQYPISNSTAFTMQDVRKIQADWKKELEEQIQNGNFNKRLLARYNLGESAGATYIRLKFRKKRTKWYWEASVLGDSTLLYLKLNKKIEPQQVIFSDNGKQEHDFRYEGKYVYGKTPVGLDSKSENCESISKQIIIKERELKINDCFILMSDALSAWVLKDEKNVSEKIEQLLKLENQKDFECFIEDIRNRRDKDNKRELENDDCTLVIIQIHKLDDKLFFSSSKIESLDSLISSICTKEQNEDICIEKNISGLIETLAREKNNIKNRIINIMENGGREEDIDLLVSDMEKWVSIYKRRSKLIDEQEAIMYNI